MKLETEYLIAPSAWASYLINGDASGLLEGEKEIVDSWVKRMDCGAPVSCEDAGFFWRHDAMKECPQGADCQKYVFLKNS